MKQPNVLILYPGQESYIGLWRPHHATEWLTVPLPAPVRGPLLLQFIDTLLTDNHLALKDVTHIGVMEGPASYTHLRVFVATANALAWSKQIPLFSFSLADILPESLSHLITKAKRNVPVEPVYPSLPK